LRLDHASVGVGDLDAAVEHLDRRLGLRATVTPEAPKRHSRVYLNRSYVEVSVASDGGPWAATMFFLRFDDPVALRAHLDVAGIAYRFGEYEGVDGTWDDVEIHAGAVPLPTLIRRTAPRDVARDWPPSLVADHRCGARTLAAVHVEVPSLDDAVPTYRRLLVGEALPEAGEEGSIGKRKRLRLASGEIVLSEGGLGGVVGLVFGVPSLATTRGELLGGRLGPTEEGVAWLNPEEAFGLRLGFAELESA
jgi:hypothetical protein